MVPLSVPTSTLDLMVVPKALASSPSSPPTMLETPSNNSMATTGKAVPSRFVKIASLALDLDLAEVDSALVEDLAEDLELVAVVLVEVDSVVGLEVAGEVLEAATVELVVTKALVLLLLLRTHLPTMRLLALTEARPFTFAM